MFDWALILGSLAVGFVVGLTGMGGGALMTPMLVLGFGIDPLTAVSSDLVAAVVMKPLGGAVHHRRGTVQWPLVVWLLLGSVPAAFAGVFLLKTLGNAQSLDHGMRLALGVALLLVATCLVVRAHFTSKGAEPMLALQVKRLPTLLVGVMGGLVVGMTSVGSGSLMIMALLLLYPRLRLSDLVGTDLVQAVPLVASAAFGHLLFGDFQLQLTGSLLLGAVPGVLAGAQLSSRCPDAVIRPALILVLTASGLKLLGLNVATVGGGALAVAGTLALQALWGQRRRAVARQPAVSAQA